MAKRASVIKDSKLQDADDREVDVELMSPTRLTGTHAQVVPMYSNAQSPRLFYAARFVNQAMPIVEREAPLVQSLDPESKDGKSFEQHYGKYLGASYWDDKDAGEVVNVTPDEISIRKKDGSVVKRDMYNNFQFNRKTYITNKPRVQKGDIVKPGQILAASNFTDDDGTMSFGRNARIAVVPYKGYSMDDAIVVSESFANKMRSMHNYAHELQKDADTKFGKTHYTSIFPQKFTKEQLENLDENGIVKPGTVLKKGDPIMLATRPKAAYSNMSHLGKLGKAFKTMRSDAAEVWEHDYPGYVSDSVEGKKSRRVFVTAEAPLKVGDKITIRNGQKDIVSKILKDNEMLQDKDGNPFEVLLNPLSLPSRVNTATLYELAVGKVAKKQGKPIAMPAFTKKGESRLATVKKMLADAGESATEEVFDPVLQRKLEKPVTTGVAYVNKLHHVVESKQSARGNASYSADEQPLRGGSDSAQAKKLGGLETVALMAKGGYANLREASTLRGQKNDAYWQAVRQGFRPAEPGKPFVFDKFKVLLNGAGMNARDLGKGKLRLAPMTDKDLDEHAPIEIENGSLVNPDTMDGEDGGLFDKKLVALDKWGKISLPSALPNPAFEKQVALLLGVKVSDLRKVIAGEVDLEDVRQKK